jgi:hypothetical protein
MLITTKDFEEASSYFAGIYDDPEQSAFMVSFLEMMTQIYACAEALYSDPKHYGPDVENSHDWDSRSPQPLGFKIALDVIWAEMEAQGYKRQPWNESFKPESIQRT